MLNPASDTHVLLRRVLTATLPGAVSTPGLETQLGDGAFQSMMAVANRHRVVGYVQQAVDEGLLALTGRQRQELAQRHLAWCTSMLGLEAERLRVLRLLEGAGIDVIVLKGTAAAHLHHDDPGYRLFGDNDVLIRTDQIDTAVHLLCANGYRRPRAPARPGFDRRFGKGATLVGRDGVELDVYRTLALGSFGLTVDLDELWTRTTSFELGGDEVVALDAEARLLHAAFHAALGDAEPKLGVVRDLAEQIRREDYVAAQVQDMVERWEATAVVQRALLLLRDVLGLHDLGPLAGPVLAHQATSREHRAMASYVAENRSFTAKVLASLPYLPRWRDRIGLIASVGLPSRAFLRSWGHRRGLAWWRRGLVSFVRGLRR